ncbi:MAG: ArnT family glycosyltransferase, partial [Nitrospinales bacterium]
MIPRKSFAFPLFIFLFAYAVRLVYLFHFQENPYFDYIPPLWDQASYDLAASEFASGNYSFILNYGEKFSAFYKYFLGVVYLLVDRDFFWVWSVQFLFGALSAVLVYAIGLRLFDRKIALLSSALFALYGPQIYYEAILYREFLATFFVLLSCYAALRYADDPNSKNAVWMALPFSLMAQCRPNLILLAPFVIWFLVSADKERGFAPSSGKRVAVFVFTILVAMAPLWASSVWVHKRFVFIDDS